MVYPARLARLVGVLAARALPKNAQRTDVQESRATRALTRRLGQRRPDPRAGISRYDEYGGSEEPDACQLFSVSSEPGVHARAVSAEIRDSAANCAYKDHGGSRNYLNVTIKRDDGNQVPRTFRTRRTDAWARVLFSRAQTSLDCAASHRRLFWAKPATR
jgi:hypothetical protein